MSRPKVFMIMPFQDEYFSLYDYLKATYSSKYDFSHAGDLDNQQNIIKDIVTGIYQADVIVADLTTLNPNVFYELGMAHGLNKKVISITQDIDELPFDIRQYRANQYSTHFSKISNLTKKLTELLDGAVNNSIVFGSPVSDYISKDKTSDKETNLGDSTEEGITNDKRETEDDKGFIDFITEINDDIKDIGDKVEDIGNKMNTMNQNIQKKTDEINRAGGAGRVDANFVKSITRQIATYILSFSDELKAFNASYSEIWGRIENNYLQLLDNKFSSIQENQEGMQSGLVSINELKNVMHTVKDQFSDLASSIDQIRGIERRLNQASRAFYNETNTFASLLSISEASIDRIIAKITLIL